MGMICDVSEPSNDLACCVAGSGTVESVRVNCEARYSR